MNTTSTKCPYPGCAEDEEHDGDHRIVRTQQPALPLVMVQRFERASVRCDIHPLEWAVALYKDNNGYGWQLCQKCITNTH